MSLYQEILFLKHFFKGLWCVENVVSYYQPLIQPMTVQRHNFWCNFLIRDFSLPADNIEKGLRKDWEEKCGFDLSKYGGIRKDTVLRNCVAPALGKHILDLAIHPIEYQKGIF